MPKCSICSHPQRRRIDRAIAHGERNIAEQFQLSRSAICRHRRHIKDAIVKAQDAEVADAISLFEQVRRLATDARRITALAERCGKLSIALRGLREVSRNLELMGRLSGELQSGAAVSVGIGVATLSAEEQELLSRHRAFRAMSDEEREAHTAQIKAEIAHLEAKIARFGRLPAKHLASANSGNVISRP